MHRTPAPAPAEMFRAIRQARRRMGCTSLLSQRKVKYMALRLSMHANALPARACHRTGRAQPSHLLALQSRAALAARGERPVGLSIAPHRPHSTAAPHGHCRKGELSLCRVFFSQCLLACCTRCTSLHCPGAVGFLEATPALICASAFTGHLRAGGSRRAQHSAGLFFSLIEAVSCKHSCHSYLQAPSSTLAMAQNGEVLFESVFSSHRTLLDFACLHTADRQAFQAADFYLHADIRWFFLRAPPVADARGAGTASDSSTSTRLSASMPTLAS